MNSSQYLAWIERSAAALAAAQDALTALDTAIGDGDHGANIRRGFDKAAEKLRAQAGQDLGSLAKATGMTLLSSVGGASGPLYGTLFLKAAPALTGKTDIDTATLAHAIADGVAGLAARGQAAVGDKTMIDVWQPAAAALQQAAADGAAPAAACAKAAAVAQAAAESTIPLVARKGRASYLGERSAGHEDPGAASSAIILQALAEVLA
ncbi:dihydroxyacetone kinase subunit DhaL [uncultured Cardiobacterium sp.]|uniref:dihydroxyacetone kinase subunit DhaL n=1 Tax=uncultured Cardiobacterium sp. TaxID=417619 RepID=UPI002632B5C7|nr:dihydroxyacetone kinase subunit DhaL [uncultured Cardiobacterium sp.]